MVLHGTSQTAPNKRVRNSNIEVLRLLAMLLIAFIHFPYPSGVQAYPNSGSFANSFCYMFLFKMLTCWGGVGDCLFFGITAWFLCEEQPSFRKSLTRAWQLEKQLWYYSLLFLALEVAKYVKHGQPMPKERLLDDILSTLFPVSSDLWWYPAAYILFLLLYPFITVALRSLGKRLHCALCIVSLLVWGLSPFYQDTLHNGYSHGLYGNVFVFIYLYVLLSCLRWYFSSLVQSKRLAFIFCGVGFLLGSASQFVHLLLSVKLQNHLIGWRSWTNNPVCFPSMLIALGLLIFANVYRPHYSRVVNKFASGALPVYLVLLHPFTLALLTSKVNIVFAALKLGYGYRRIGVCVGMAVMLYIAVLLFDFIRQSLFSHVFNRNPNRFLNWVLEKVTQFSWVKRVEETISEA
ncbi:acyltransferase [Bifidobacterium sp. ESL0769]|uniref:acyltransferase family protein n=1 Tax=Bifidobacterium sp. ESL0769 TaxID=2983229 RepID=UPI0023F9FE91|nr:acyltransferase [Bifidobacterium sp. ESL0769]WEV67744.1 acyltransferase [Bifidobacterium sp. ESL0769]